MNPPLMPTLNRTTRRTTRAGFTLVELLTVIAIIAILTAIILPVFSIVRENARRASCQSNMQKIATAVKQYELDNRQYPEYLFGPAVDDATGLPLTGGGTARSIEKVIGDIGAQTSTSTPQADRDRIKNIKQAYARGLYPEYISDVNTFHCPDNNIADTTGEVPPQTALVQRYMVVGKTAGTTKTDMAFYKYDSYDANPVFNAAGKLQGGSQARYARQWQPNIPGGNYTGLTPEEQTIYRNQLYFATPSSDTYVTMCTYHAPYGKIVVSWLNGQSKALDANKLRNNPAYGPSNGTDYDVYKLTPNK